MKRLFFFALPLLLLISVAIVWANLPGYLIPKIETLVHEQCEDCTLKIESMTLTPTHKISIRLNDIKFKYHPNDAIEAFIESIYITLPWSILYSSEYFIDGIAFVKPNVIYTDGDRKTVSTIKKPNLPIFKINNTEIIDGKFRYNRHTAGTKASFNIQGIKGELSIVGNTPELKKQATQLRASGQVENSGESHLAITTFLWEDNVYIDTELKVKEQNLDDLSIFLKDNAGVSLSGTLLRGETLLQVRDKNLRTFLLATYNHFDIQFDPMYDRNEITAFFMNFYSTILVNRKNTAKNDPKREFVDITREPKESLVSFMLRGLKEAAILLVKAQPL